MIQDSKLHQWVYKLSEGTWISFTQQKYSNTNIYCLGLAVRWEINLKKASEANFEYIGTVYILIVVVVTQALMNFQNL